ncbi:TonB family protein [Synechococcus moorigangaii CMS01]|nr:TonB family protein [Synechococcus moorigangaii CMS01]
MSDFCQQEREQEQAVLKKWLACGLVGSVVLHGGALLGLRWLPATETVSSEQPPLEFIVTETTPPPEPVETPQETLTEPETTAPSSNADPVAPEAPATPAPPTAIAAVRPQVTTPEPQAPTPEATPEPESQAVQEPVSEPESQVVENNSAPLTPASENTNPLRNQLQAAASGVNRNITANNGNPNGANRTRPTNPGTASRPLGESEGNTGLNALRSGLQGNARNSSGSNNNAPGNQTAAQRSTPNRPTNNPPAAPVASGAGCSAPSQPQFPASLASRGIEARPVVEVVTGTNGSVTQARILQSSNYAALDQAALSAARGIRCPSGEQRRVRLAINFAQPGTDFQREAQQRQAEAEQQRQEQIAREQEQQRLAEQARQQQEAEAQQQAAEQQATQEAQRQAEAEQQRQAEAERQRQAELEQERQAEAERQRQAELERQRQAEAERQRQAELERQLQQQQQQQADPAEVGG